MRRNSTLWGIVGLVLLIFGLVDYFVTSGSTFRPFVVVNIVGGFFALILWATSGYSELASMVGSRTTRYGANAILYSIGFIGLLTAINYYSSQHHRRLDLTEERVFSLSSQSVNVVKGLQKRLKFYGFFEGGANPRALALYESYAYASPKVSYEMVDPDRHPELAEKFKVSAMGTTHVQYGNEGEGTNVTELSEENLTNAIVKVTKGGKKVVDFLDGHGEADPDDSKSATGLSALRQALEGEGYEVKKLLLATQATVPSDCNILVIAGPRKPLLPHELEEIDKYLKHGGRVVVMLRVPQPTETQDPGLLKLVQDWGVKPGNDVVVDQVIRLFAGPALGLNPMVNNYPEHPVTHGFAQRTVFPLTRSVEPLDHKPGLSVTPLAKTSETSWAETDLDGIFKRQSATFTANDRKGPITVVDAVDADLKAMGAGDGTARLIVYGGSEFADNQYINNFFNRDFFINGVDWLAGEEKSISIRPRSLRASRFRLTVEQFSIVFALSVLLLPEGLLLAGIVVWWKRRN